MLRDAGFAIRQFLKAPGFTGAAIFTLALAICANLTIFSAADAVLLHPLPYPHPEQLVIVQENLPAHNLHQIAPSPENFAEFRRRADVFSAIAGIINNDVTLSGNGSPEYADSARVSPSLFPMLGVVPVLGSLFTSAQEQPGQDSVVILSEARGFVASAPTARLLARRFKSIAFRIVLLAWSAPPRCIAPKPMFGGPSPSRRRKLRRTRGVLIMWM
jgi:hypothetical protein